MTNQVMAQSLECSSTPDNDVSAATGAALARSAVDHHQNRVACPGRGTNSDSGTDRSPDDSERGRRTFPAALFLRLRVTQIVLGILVTLLATVVCIEESGSHLQVGGTGIIAGLVSVVAAGTNIHASRYCATEAIGWTLVAVWSPDEDRSRSSALAAVALSALWMTAGAVNGALIVLVVVHVPASNPNLVALGIMEVVLASMVLVIALVAMAVSWRYDKFQKFKYKG